MRYGVAENIKKTFGAGGGTIGKLGGDKVAKIFSGGAMLKVKLVKV